MRSIEVRSPDFYRTEFRFDDPALYLFGMWWPEAISELFSSEPLFTTTTGSGVPGTEITPLKLFGAETLIVSRLPLILSTLKLSVIKLEFLFKKLKSFGWSEILDSERLLVSTFRCEFGISEKLLPFDFGFAGESGSTMLSMICIGPRSEF